MNKKFSSLRKTVTSLLSLYQTNIKRKFLLLNRKLLIGGRKPFDERLKRFEDLLHSYRIGFSDFRLHTYVFNLEGIAEHFFPLWKIIDYRSKLELEWVNKGDKEHHREGEDSQQTETIHKAYRKGSVFHPSYCV